MRAIATNSANAFGGTQCHTTRLLIALAAWLLVAIGPSVACGADLQSPSGNTPETGAVTSSLASFDKLMREFIHDNKLPGAALAVAKDGRLVYARGFGYADIDNHQPVQPGSLFRIASISKPITAVALLQLAESKDNEQADSLLDASVFDLLTHRPRKIAGEDVDPRLKQITIRQLLQHRGGWDRAQSIDPMFQSLEIATNLGTTAPAKPDDIISFMLTWQLDFTPGERYAYSNFGYCVLGRVIEQVSGEAYATYVRRHLLRPMGIERMRIGRSLARQRCAGEVKYYTTDNKTGMAVVGTPIARQVPRPYGTWYLEAMDAHGGWIGSAIDLVRFGTQVQHWRSSGVLSAKSYQAMIARPSGSAGYHGDGKPKDSYYGLGWQVREVGDGHNLWHSGALPGTSTLLVQRHDGLCWAVLFNTTYTPDGKRPAIKIDGLIHKAADAVTQWPQHDLFQELQQPHNGKQSSASKSDGS